MLAPQHEAVEQVGVVEGTVAGEGPQVDVHVDPHARAGLGASVHAPATASLGAAQPPTDGRERIELLVVAEGIELLVELVAPIHAVEGVFGTALIGVADPVVTPVIAGIVAPVGETERGEVVKGVGPPLGQRPAVRGVGRVGTFACRRRARRRPWRSWPG